MDQMGPIERFLFRLFVLAFIGAVFACAWLIAFYPIP